MNAWTPSVATPARARAGGAARRTPGAKTRRAAPPTRIARRGRRTATGCATPSSGASRTSATSIWSATCRASSGAPGFELFYSVGFHPKPELSFGPALGLGIPSLGELLDVTLIDDLSPDELLRAAARASRWTGIDFLEAARARRQRPRARPA